MLAPLCNYLWGTHHYLTYFDNIFWDDMVFLNPKLEILRLRCPDSALLLLHRHYDMYRHEQSGMGNQNLFYIVLKNPGPNVIKNHVQLSIEHLWDDWCLFAGLPQEILQMEYYVPGSTCRQECERYKGKKVFATILAPTDETVMMYFTRATQDPEWCGSLINAIHSWHFLQRFLSLKLIFLGSVTQSYQ